MITLYLQYVLQYDHCLHCLAHPAWSYQLWSPSCGNPVVWQSYLLAKYNQGIMSTTGTVDQAMSIRTLDLQVLLMEEPWTSTLVSYIATIATTVCMFCYQGECLPQAVRALSL